MRKIIVLLFVIIIVVNNVFSQDVKNIKINKQFAGKHLVNILADLERSYGLAIDYNKEDLPNKILSSKFFFDASLVEVFESILSNTDLYYSIVDDEIIIRKKGVAINKFEKTYERKFDFDLSGKITDKETGESLPFAQIKIKGTSNGTISNVDGYFTLFNVPFDTTVLEISYLGYETKKLKLSPKLVSKSLLIELRTESKKIDEIIVHGERDNIIKISDKVSMVSLSPQKIAELPCLGEKDIFRSLQLLPGISGSNESSSGLYVRGGTPDQNLILYDGFTVYHVDHLFGMFSAFNSNAIKDVKLSKGGFEAKHGGRLSSVMEITGKDGNEKNFNLGGGIGFISMNGFMEIPLNNKGSILINGRKSFQSFLYNNIFESFNSEDDNEPTSPMGASRGGKMRSFSEAEPSSYFYDFNAKLTYKPTSRDILSYSFYNGQDDLDNSRDMSMSRGGLSMSGGTTDLTKWGNWGNSLKWSRRWNEYVYTNSLLSFSQYYSMRDMTMERTINRDEEEKTVNMGTVEDNVLEDFSFKTDNEWKLNKNNQIEFGAQLTHYNINYDFTRNDTIIIQSRHDRGQLYATYLQDRIKFEKLTIVPGIRANFYSETEKIYIEPRFSIIYDLTKKFKLKGAVGKYHQFAKRIIRDDIESGSRDFWVLADDDIIPIGKSNHYILGVQYETPNYLFDVETFYKELDGLSEYTLLFAPSFMNVNFDEFFYEGEGIAKGIEFMAQKKYGRYSGWIGYTLSQVEYKFPVYGNEWYKANHDATHEFKIVNTYKWKNWTFAGTWIYATGKPYTAPIGGYELSYADGTVNDFITVGEKNIFRLPAYHRMDLSATLEFAIGDTGIGNLSFSVFNLYGRKNVWYKEFELIDDELIETDVNLLGITPNISLSIKLR